MIPSKNNSAQRQVRSKFWEHVAYYTRQTSVSFPWTLHIPQDRFLLYLYTPCPMLNVFYKCLRDE